MLRIIDGVIQFIQVEAELQFGCVPQQPSFPANGNQTGFLLLDLGDAFRDIFQDRQLGNRLDGFDKKRACFRFGRRRAGQLFAYKKSQNPDYQNAGDVDGIPHISHPR